MACRRGLAAIGQGRERGCIALKRVPGHKRVECACFFAREHCGEWVAGRRRVKRAYMSMLFGV